LPKDEGEEEYIMKKIAEHKMHIYYLLIGLAAIYCFLFLLYPDNIINSQAGYDYIDHIFCGDFISYFNSSSWSYGLSIYTIYAIWSIPVWLIFHILGIAFDISLIPVLLWYKLLLVVFAIWSIYLIGKIAEETYGELKGEIQLQYVCSAFFLFPAFYIAQCDIMGLCFVLAGIYYYIKEDNKKFLLFFAVAITMKYFALFVFIPLILFRYRKIRKMLYIFGAGCVLVAISILIIETSSAGAGAMANGAYYVNEHIERLSEISVVINERISIGLLGFFYTLLCVVAYVIPNDDKERNKRYAIWLALSGYLSFFLFYICNYYWYILLAPFVILVAFNRLKYTKLNLLLISVFESLTGICSIFMMSWVFMGATAYNYLFLRRFGENVTENSMLFVFRKISENVFYEGWDWNNFLPVWNGIAYASIILLLVLNFPGLNSQAEPVDENIKDEALADIRAIAGLRIAIIYLWIFVSLFCLIRSQ